LPFTCDDPLGRLCFTSVGCHFSAVDGGLVPGFLILFFVLMSFAAMSCESLTTDLFALSANADEA
jgi:hypothetical protein